MRLSQWRRKSVNICVSCSVRILLLESLLKAGEALVGGFCEEDNR
jgi:hypothetical protein